MKQTWKKITGIVLMLCCIFALTACGSSKKVESVALDDVTKTTMISTAEGLSETIVVLGDEEITSYKDSGDEFTMSAMEAWENSKKDLGAFKEKGEAVVKAGDKNTYTVTLPAKFEKADADFVYTFDKQGTPTALSLDIQYSFGQTMERAGLNTLMGLVVVFLMLVFLTFVISLFKYIPKLEEKFTKKKETAAEEITPAVKAVPAAAAEPRALEDDTQLTAVVAAAIAAYEGTSADGFVVRSIRKAKHKKW